MLELNQVKTPSSLKAFLRLAPESVFQAWTDPKIIMQWFDSAPVPLYSATIDLRPGGAWQILKSRNEEKSVGFEGEYLEVEPNAGLVFTWSHVVAYANGERDSTPYSHVEVNFTPNGTGTDVRIVHSGMNNAETRRGFAGGWEFAFGTMISMFSKTRGKSRLGNESGVV